MRHTSNAVLFLLAILCLSACGKKADELTAEEKIAGKEEKTWKADKEVTSAGDIDKLSREEKKETITFWRNGNVKMTQGDQVVNGQWSLEGSNLRLQFTGSDVSENFEVLNIDRSELRLKAGDGSVMTMKPG